MELPAGIPDDDKHVDWTDEWEMFEKGKATECECGQGIGTSHETRLYVCPTCGKVLYDLKHTEREPPERDEGQSKLGEFL